MPPAEEAQVDLSAAVEERLPTFIPPMNATLNEGPFSDPGWMFEFKWDGFRIQARVDGGRVQLPQPQGQSADAWFPQLAGPPTWISARSAIVDGESWPWAPTAAPPSALLQDQLSPGPGRKRSALVYQVFDLLHLDGRSLLDVPSASGASCCARCCGAPVGAGHDLGGRRRRDYFEAVKAQGLEG